MKIEFLFWDGCPSHPEARALLAEVLAEQGLDAEVEEHEVTTIEEAQRLAFPGSPTIRVDGRDVQPLSDEPIGLSCRVYRTTDGRVSPVPDRLEVRQTLTDAMKGGDD